MTSNINTSTTGATCPSVLPRGEALTRCRLTTSIDEVIALTKHSDPFVRQRALKEMCPCRSEKGIDDFWARVLEMKNDPNTAVRFQVNII